MARKQKSKFMMGVFSAAGAAAAFFGTRAIVRFLQQQSHDRERFERLRDRFDHQPSLVDRDETPPTPRYQPIDQPDRFYEPDTGSHQQDQGEMTGATSYSERAGIPATGMGAALPDTMEYTRDQSLDTSVNLAMPVAQYLLTFYSMINLLRARRNSSGIAGARSLNADDVGRYSESLDRLRELTPEMDVVDLPEGSSQGMAYSLILKVRDALENSSYNDDDLFRINGEVKSMACRVLSMMDEGETGTYLDQARQAFDCQ